MPLEWREKAGTGKIHIFPVSKGGGKYRNRNPRPHCGCEGPFTFPLEVPDVLAKNICVRCLEYPSRAKKEKVVDPE